MAVEFADLRSGPPLIDLDGEVLQPQCGQLDRLRFQARRVLRDIPAGAENPLEVRVRLVREASFRASAYRSRSRANDSRFSESLRMSNSVSCAGFTARA